MLWMRCSPMLWMRCDAMRCDAMFADALDAMLWMRCSGCDALDAMRCDALDANLQLMTMRCNETILQVGRKKNPDQLPGPR